MSRPKRSLGQNFLIDPNTQRKIVDALSPAPDDRVLEVGPGRGALTQHLVGQVGRLVLVELDDELAADLQARYGDRGDVEVVHDDILELDPGAIEPGEPLKVIGNIPYGITSPLVFHLLDRSPLPDPMVLTVQKEVADRLAAQPGTKSYGALTVGVQAIARVERLFNVSPNSFRPRPDVESTTVRISPIQPPPLSGQDQVALRTLTRAAFSRRRKQMQKVLRQTPEYSLSADEVVSLLRELDIDPRVRPDALPVEDYLRLARELSGSGR